MERNRRDVLKLFLSQVDGNRFPTWAAALSREITDSRKRLNRFWARRARLAKKLARNRNERTLS